MMMNRKPAILLLQDGTTWEGYSIGADCRADGEVVFSTGMVGYSQSLTDPSYRGQILTFTWPLVGNYGVPLLKRDRYGIPLNFESDRIQAAGVVVSEASEEPSHHTAALSFGAWLKREGIPGIAGIDTRSLTRKLREQGVMRGAIIVERDHYSDVRETNHTIPVAEVSIRSPILYPGNPGAPLIALVDCGVKANILRLLVASKVNLLRLPWDYPLETVEYDGLFISNGPGDPKSCTKTIASLRSVLTKYPYRPVFGICLGNQLLALAAGADTWKLKYGHRSQNQPVIEQPSGACHITSQNHGYAVHADSLPSDWEPWFINANDGTIEGIKSQKAPIRAVQFHPEG
ncbi:MAG: glutamine-hydrolyzing carbamoyl-phosphate synthase small subunit, partial [Rectinema sp.]|nr:glutamine-hydrolyzing carbamoyl-phosphate synthase small subunit [Rectinema sp.]